MNSAELIKSIETMTVCAIGPLPKMQLVRWFAPMAPEEFALRVQVDPKLQGDTPEAQKARIALLSELEPTIFQAGQPCPIHDSVIFAIFQGIEGVRVYTLHDKNPPMRFTLSMTARTFTGETMSLDTFKSEVSAEWEALDTATFGEDDDEDDKTNGSAA